MLPLLQFGTIENPLHRVNANGYGELTDTNGLILFVSNVVRFIMIAGGLFAFFNLIVAGFTYISAGSDAKKTAEAWAKIYMSLMGLVVIVASYAITAVISLLLFGDTNAILNPKIYGPGT